MKCTKLELVLISACNLPNVRRLGRMKVYAEVSINGDPKTAARIAVDREGKTDPSWNCQFDYTVAESDAGGNVVVKLMCARRMGDKFISEVKIPLKSLFEKAENTASYSCI